MHELTNKKRQLIDLLLAEYKINYQDYPEGEDPDGYPNRIIMGRGFFYEKGLTQQGYCPVTSSMMTGKPSQVVQEALKESSRT
jgi:hypothetical protein